MKNIVNYWRGEIDRNWIIVFVILTWLINAGMNASMGYATGGSFYAAVFFGLAGLGAYAANVQAGATGARRAMLWMLVIMQVAFGQMAGWQTLGLTLETGAAKLAGDAALYGVTGDKLKRFRAERRALGIITRPVATVEAAEAYECASGVGPRCTKLRVELGKARRAATLDQAIGRAVLAYRTAPAIADGDAQYRVPAAFATGLVTWAKGTGRVHEITPADVRFGWLVFLVFALEFVATFGFWLFGTKSSPLSDYDEPELGVGGADQFNLAQLPAPPRRRAITGGDRDGAGVAAGMASYEQAPLGLGAGGTTNVINVGNDRFQNLPPRAAAQARRA